MLATCSRLTEEGANKDVRVCVRLVFHVADVCLARHKAARDRVTARRVRARHLAAVLVLRVDV